MEDDMEFDNVRVIGRERWKEALRSSLDIARDD